MADESGGLPGGWQDLAPRGLTLPFHFFLGSALRSIGSALHPGLWGNPERLRASERVLLTLLVGTTPVSTFHLTRLVTYHPKSLHFYAHGGKQPTAESHPGTMGAASIIELAVKVTREPHRPRYLAVWLYFIEVTVLAVLNNSQCSSVQAGYIHFNLKETEIKMAQAL